MDRIEENDHGKSAAYEISTRLIACFLNERMFRASAWKCPVPSIPKRGIRLDGWHEAQDECQLWIATTRLPAANCLWHESDFSLPILLRKPHEGVASMLSRVVTPEEVLLFARGLVDDEGICDAGWKDVFAQVDSAFRNLSIIPAPQRPATKIHATT